MKVNYLDPRLGDSLLAEPAMSAYVATKGDRISLYVEPWKRIFYADHPLIDLVDHAHESPDVIPSCTAAFNVAGPHNLPFGSGYYPQFDLTYKPGDRVHYQGYSKPFTRPARMMADRIVIAPFCKSCSGHQGQRNNVEPPLAWWKPIFDAFPERTVSLGDGTDPAIGSDLNFRNLSWDAVISILRGSGLLVTVETGILHLATACGIPTVFLSSATPEVFCRPAAHVRHEIVRGLTPYDFNQDDCIYKMKLILEED